MYQARYWKELYQLKVHLNYIELYLQNTEFNDKAIKIFLALTSSSSIAAWAIWREAAPVWAIIIAASQVIAVIQSFLPYKARLKYLPELRHEFEELVHLTEKRWFDVSEGKLTEEEIHELQFGIRSRKNKALKKHLGNDTLPENPNLFNKAQESADIYFKNFYNTEE